MAGNSQNWVLKQYHEIAEITNRKITKIFEDLLNLLQVSRNDDEKCCFLMDIDLTVVCTYIYCRSPFEFCPFDQPIWDDTQWRQMLLCQPIPTPSIHSNGQRI